MLEKEICQRVDGNFILSPVVLRDAGQKRLREEDSRQPEELHCNPSFNFRHLNAEAHSSTTENFRISQTSTVEIPRRKF